MLSQLGALLGLVYCLYKAVFRWNALVGKYGILSLYWWVLAVTIATSYSGYILDIAIWAIQYGLWRGWM